MGVGKNPTRTYELISGLGDVENLGIDDASGGPLLLHIWNRAGLTCGATVGRCDPRAQPR